ncbi:MAG: hypothetical protein KA426_01260 [Nitrospira sp.]|nr:hypothetical protein [Nitrospira sp.]HQY58251.1 hypothetical protein [Nitrospira sp.]
MMARLKQHWPLLLMFSLLFVLLGTLPILASWQYQKWGWVPTRLPGYQLRWVVVSNESLRLGERVKKAQVALQLNYLSSNRANDEKPTVHSAAQTHGSVDDLYVLSDFDKDSPLTKNSLEIEPKFEPASGNLIIPVSVRREYAHGLRPSMQLWFGNAGASESVQTEVSKPELVGAKGSKVVRHTAFNDQIKPASVETKNSDSKEKCLLLVSLRAIIPSANNENALLYVEIPKTYFDRLSELIRGNLVPVILPGAPPAGRKCP